MISNYLVGIVMMVDKQYLFHPLDSNGHVQLN